MSAIARAPLPKTGSLPVASPLMMLAALSLPPKGLKRTELPDSRGVCLYVSARDVSNLGPRGGDLPAGTRAVSVFVVNERNPEVEERVDEGHLFQAQLILRLKEGFVPLRLFINIGQ